MGKRILPRGEVAWLPSLQQGKDDWALLLGSLGRLYVAGATIRREPEQR
jgi:acyl transferase domain-containing protein